MQNRLFAALFLIAVITVARAQDSIVYVSGPSFPFPVNFRAGNLDVDGDGTPDFSFFESGIICTADVPTSGCGWAFQVGAEELNELLMAGNSIQPLLFGEWIGNTAPPGSVWKAPGSGYYGAGLAYWWYSRQGRVIDGQLLHSGWSGALGEAGVGYIGIRFHAADGLHYGWIRARLPI